MSLSSKFRFPLLAPTIPDGNSASKTVGGTPSGNMSKDDVITFLGEGDDAEPEDIIDLDPPKDKDDKLVKKSKSSKDSKEDEEDEDEDTDEDSEDDESDDDGLDELEDDLKEPGEEDLELVSPVRRKEILKKYPKLFEDFPYLEKAYYREQQFTELFSTIPDAKDAAGKAETWDQLETELGEGNLEGILRAAKDAQPQGFLKIADDYLTTLGKVDEKAYHHVIGNTIKSTIQSMVAEARASKDENLQAAAEILHRFVFASSEWKPVSRLSDSVKPEVNKEKEEISKEREDFRKERFDTTRNELNTRVTNALKATIEANLDPKESMTTYVKKNASRDVMEQVEGLIDKDSRFKSIVDKLWEKAAASNFSKASIDTIKGAYLSKARTLLPSVIKKARNEALRGMGKRVRDNDENDAPRGPVTKTGRSQSQSRTSDEDKPRKSGKITKASDIPAGMKSIDFLMMDD